MFILLFYYKVDKVDTGPVIRGIPPGFPGYDEPGFWIRDRHLLYGSWTKNTFDTVYIFRKEILTGFSLPHGSSLLSDSSAEKKKGLRSCDRDPLNL